MAESEWSQIASSNCLPTPYKPILCDYEAFRSAIRIKSEHACSGGVTGLRTVDLGVETGVFLLSVEIRTLLANCELRRHDLSANRQLHLHWGWVIDCANAAGLASLNAAVTLTSCQ